MKKKIFYSIVWIVLAVLIISDVLFTVLMYQQFLDQMKIEVRNNMVYIERAVEEGGLEYLNSLPRGDDNSRITLIDEDGTVLYDSVEDANQLENHSDRDEFVEAIATGVGEAYRYSGSVGKQTYYYAITMEDGTILRLSSTITSVFMAIGDSVPFLILFVAIAIVVSFVAANIQSKKLTKPVNELNLDEPLENDVYEELSPLLMRLENQNRQIKEQRETERSEQNRFENQRREFVANVSHELKTPLMSISGYAEIIQNGMVKTEDIPDFSKRIYQEAKRLTTLVEDIIRLSQFDDTEYVHAMEPVELKNLSEKVVAYLQHQADKRGISISVEGDSLVIDGAPGALEEMIYNLCDNAVKYNKADGSVKITLVNNEKERSITVADTGIGIPKECQDRVFERFYRVDKSHSRESGGTGLGLSIVKHAAMLHNATISLESKMNEGTAITVRF